MSSGWVPCQWLIPTTDLALILKSDFLKKFEKEIKFETPSLTFPKIIFLVLGDHNPLNYNVLCKHWSQTDDIQHKIVKLLMERWRWSGCKVNDCNPTRLWWTDALATQCSQPIKSFPFSVGGTCNLLLTNWVWHRWWNVIFRISLCYMPKVLGGHLLDYMFIRLCLSWLKRESLLVGLTKYVLLRKPSWQGNDGSL